MREHIGDVEVENVARPKKSLADESNLRKELVRERLVDTAAELFSRRGYSRSTMNEIAEALGLSRSALYHYFRNKEEILEALIEEQTSPHAESLRSIMADARLDALGKLREALHQSILHKLTANARFRVLDQIEFEMPEPYANRHRRRKREILDLWSRLVEAGTEAGDIRGVDPRMAAFALLGISNWTAWWFQPSGKLSAAQVADSLVDIALNGLSGHGRAPKSPPSIDAAIERLKADLHELERLAR